MLNLLIVSSDACLTKTLLQNISKENLVDTSDNYSTELSTVLGLDKADILFLSKDTVDIYNASSKYKKHRLIAVSLDEKKELVPKAKKSLNDLINYCTNEKKQRIIAELESISYNFKYRGTYYLIDAILEVQKSAESKIDSLQKDLYPIIAKKYGKTVHDIKNCISTATDSMYCDCNIDHLKKYFNLCQDEKPSIKRIIYTIANKTYN